VNSLSVQKSQTLRKAMPRQAIVKLPPVQRLFIDFTLTNRLLFYNFIGDDGKNPHGLKINLAPKLEEVI
jgi:hypothetical protein